MGTDRIKLLYRMSNGDVSKGLSFLLVKGNDAERSLIGV